MALGSGQQDCWERPALEKHRINVFSALANFAAVATCLCPVRQTLHCGRLSWLWPACLFGLSATQDQNMAFCHRRAQTRRY